METKYWEKEQVVEVDVGANVLRFFKNAGRLQIAVKYVDADGIPKRGRYATLNIGCVRRNPAALDIFRQIVAV
jgi:hypothetical protein